MTLNAKSGQLGPLGPMQILKAPFMRRVAYDTGTWIRDFLKSNAENLAVMFQECRICICTEFDYGFESSDDGDIVYKLTDSDLSIRGIFKASSFERFNNSMTSQIISSTAEIIALLPGSLIVLERFRILHVSVPGKVFGEFVIEVHSFVFDRNDKTRKTINEVMHRASQFIWPSDEPQLHEVLRNVCNKKTGKVLSFLCKAPLVTDVLKEVRESKSTLGTVYVPPHIKKKYGLDNPGTYLNNQPPENPATENPTVLKTYSLATSNNKHAQTKSAEQKTPVCTVLNLNSGMVTEVNDFIPPSSNCVIDLDEIGDDSSGQMAVQNSGNEVEDNAEADTSFRRLESCWSESTFNEKSLLPNIVLKRLSSVEIDAHCGPRKEDSPSPTRKREPLKWIPWENKKRKLFPHKHKSDSPSKRPSVKLTDSNTETQIPLSEMFTTNPMNGRKKQQKVTIFDPVLHTYLTCSQMSETLSESMHVSTSQGWDVDSFLAEILSPSTDNSNAQAPPVSSEQPDAVSYIVLSPEKSLPNKAPNANVNDVTVQSSENVNEDILQTPQPVTIKPKVIKSIYQDAFADYLKSRDTVDAKIPATKPVLGPKSVQNKNIFIPPRKISESSASSKTDSSVLPSTDRTETPKKSSPLKLPPATPTITRKISDSSASSKTDSSVLPSTDRTENPKKMSPLKLPPATPTVTLTKIQATKAVLGPKSAQTKQFSSPRKISESSASSKIDSSVSPSTDRTETHKNMFALKLSPVTVDILRKDSEVAENYLPFASSQKKQCRETSNTNFPPLPASKKGKINSMLHADTRQGICKKIGSPKTSANSRQLSIKTSLSIASSKKVKERLTLVKQSKTAVQNVSEDKTKNKCSQGGKISPQKLSKSPAKEAQPGKCKQIVLVNISDSEGDSICDVMESPEEVEENNAVTVSESVDCVEINLPTLITCFRGTSFYPQELLGQTWVSILSSLTDL